jgi:hypothetical protein
MESRSRFDEAWTMVSAELTLDASDTEQLKKILFKQRRFFQPSAVGFSPDEQALHFQRRSGEERGHPPAARRRF